MSEPLAILIDANAVEWWPIASGALVLFLGGITVAIVQRRWSREDAQDQGEKKAIHKELTDLGVRIATETDQWRSAIAIECRERQAAIAEEGNIRSRKDDELGRDISRIRERMAYDRGQAKKPYPKDED